MKPVIVIPTFVSKYSERTLNESFQNYDIPPIAKLDQMDPELDPIVTTYDHSMSFTNPETLHRLFQSMYQMNYMMQIVVLVSSPSEMADEAAAAIQEVASQYPDLPIVIIGRHEVELLYKRMEQLKLGCPKKEIGLYGYGAVRNLGLMVANVMGFNAVVFLDDDAVIDDPEFIEKSMYGLGKLTQKGIPILAKSGFYYNAENSYLSGRKEQWYDKSWEQTKLFNKWISQAMRGKRLLRSNFVCGTCFVIHAEAFKRVAFDPWISRGEDLDYLLNLRMYGSDVWFDNNWHVTHLPPKRDRAAGLRFRQDIFRWLYEYRKLEFSQAQIDLMQIKPESLEPYPGPFISPSVVKRIKTTAMKRSLAHSGSKGYREAARVVTAEAEEYAQKNCTNYFTFQRMWPEMVLRLQGDGLLAHALRECVIQRRAGVAVAVPQQQSVNPGSTTEIRLNINE